MKNRDFINNLSSEQFISHYLDRISFKGPLQPDLNSLRKITANHVQHIPFEYSWDPYKKTANLNLDTLFTNIIISRSGGYCYETGMLFNYFLQTIGFHTQLVTGQIYRNGILDLTSLHLAIVVDRNWLVDISWYGGIPEPLDMRSGEQHIKSRTYKIIKTFLGYNVWEKKKDWQKAYLFSSIDNLRDAIEHKHNFHQFDKRSEFYSKHLLQYSQ